MKMLEKVRNECEKEGLGRLGERLGGPLGSRLEGSRK